MNERRPNIHNGPGNLDARKPDDAGIVATTSASSRAWFRRSTQNGAKSEGTGKATNPSHVQRFRL